LGYLWFKQLFSIGRDLEVGVKRIFAPWDEICSLHERFTRFHGRQEVLRNGEEELFVCLGERTGLIMAYVDLPNVVLMHLATLQKLTLLQGLS